MSRQTCQQCGAKCCRYFCFEIDAPDTYEEFEDIRWFLCHEGVSIHIDEGDWYISIANRCKMLTDDNTCLLYGERPLICRTYSMDNCDHTAGDYGYDALFETPEDLDRYARKTLGRAAYERAKAKARAKAGGAAKKRKKARAKTKGDAKGHKNRAKQRKGKRGEGKRT